MGAFSFTLKFRSSLFRSRAIAHPVEIITNAWWKLPDIVVGLPYSLKHKSGARYPGRMSGPTTSMPPTVIEVGYWNDQGTKHIPARPFLTGARREIQQKTLNLRKALLHKILLQGSDADIRDCCNKVGALAAAVVQRRITNWSDPPNAPSTIAAKKGVNNPLIDTGLLRKSITWELRKKEGTDATTI